MNQKFAFGHQSIGRLHVCPQIPIVLGEEGNYTAQRVIDHLRARSGGAAPAQIGGLSAVHGFNAHQIPEKIQNAIRTAKHIGGVAAVIFALVGRGQVIQRSGIGQVTDFTVQSADGFLDGGVGNDVVIRTEKTGQAAEGVVVNAQNPVGNEAGEVGTAIMSKAMDRPVTIKLSVEIISRSSRRTMGQSSEELR